MSHTKRTAARINGLAPAFLNFSILVSAPKAVIAMVRRKVSKVLMKSTRDFGRRSKLLKQMTTRKRMANHGILILPLPPCRGSSSAFRLRYSLQKAQAARRRKARKPATAAPRVCASACASATTWVSVSSSICASVLR